MVAKALSASHLGIEAILSEIETQVVKGLKKFTLVGLPDGVLRESKERVRCALENSGYEFPFDDLVVNLSPASLPKYGSGFDLAIAVSILATMEHLSAECIADKVFIGELALTGEIRPVPSVIAAAAMVRDLTGDKELIVSSGNLEQASLIEGVRSTGVKTLQELVLYLKGECLPELSEKRNTRIPALLSGATYGDVIGQHAAKRAIEIAAAGGHNLLMVGPPGSGKSMLAQRIVSVLPPLTTDEIIEITKVHAALKVMATIPGTNSYNEQIVQSRPFRAPHHTTSYAGLIGGGSNPAPGEISLAHKGILFLDELPEFKREVLESLRTPLEAKHVIISRAKLRIGYPADFMLVGAMNPCPCGKRGSLVQSCMCSHTSISRYLKKISGPFLDRIDIRLWIPPVSISDLSKKVTEDPTPTMKKRVTRARELQRERYQQQPSVLNAAMGTSQIKEHCTLSTSGNRLLEGAAKKYGLSARGYTRILRVSRTIADLEESTALSDAHVAEALSYRGLELAL